MQKTALTLTPTLPRQQTFAQPSFSRRRESRRGGSQIGNLRLHHHPFPATGVTQRSPKAGIQAWGRMGSRLHANDGRRRTHRYARGVAQGSPNAGTHLRVGARIRPGRSPSRRPSRSGRKSGLMQEECDQECWNPQPEARHLVQSQTLRPSRERLRTSPISSSLTRARPPARHRPECGRLWPAAGPPSWPRDQDRSRCPGRKA